MEKQCRVCGEWKAFSEFHSSKHGKYGVRSMCKLCGNRASHEYHIANRERIAARNSSRHARKRAERAALAPTFAERFWARVDKSGECWEWKGRRDDDGYGVLSIQRRNKRAHRVAYELACGPIQDGLLVCHSCDNPTCVRPDHLWLGTNQDNVDDRNRKGRQAHGKRMFFETPMRGQTHASAKLTAELVRDIRHQYDLGTATQVQLAAKYGVSQNTVSSIVRRRIWKHV